MDVQRRDFLRAGLMASAATCAPAAAGAVPSRLDRGVASNVIFLVSDGMSLGSLVLAERYRQHHGARSTNWMALYGRPGTRRALMDTASANSLVTDFAAASSAWGSGRRVNNGAITAMPVDSIRS